MNSSDNTTEGALLKCHRDVLWWKSMVEFIEIEITFINRLLNSNVFETTHANVFETLDTFKHQIKTETRALKNLKEIIDGHEIKMRGMLECDDLSCDAVYLSNHESLKVHFEKFLKNFFEYKTKVYNYIGSIL
ncbi:hypothetical protein [Mariniflexile sp. HMF6888]|uniref:hypothetical protein n=1 Tax=Mariniflexile sp. HMF6888 TaxID=3373086 RepID=UPI00379CC5B2